MSFLLALAPIVGGIIAGHVLRTLDAQNGPGTESPGATAESSIE
jgi:hypothetical protein